MSSKDQTNDPLSVARDEVDRLFEKYIELREHLDREKIHVSIARWKRRNGVCKYNTRLTKARFGQRMSSQPSKTGHHAIVMNERMLEDGNRDDFLDTTRHELAHALAYEMHGSSQGHNHNWKQLASMLDAEPSSCGGKKDMEYDYYIGCPECGMMAGRQTRSKVIKKPFTRKCAECGAVGMVSFDAGDEMPEESGTVAVESIPWDNKDEWYQKS